MITDLVEKCARAIHAESDDRRFNWDSLQGVQRDDFRDMALAVIDALADGVSDEMVTKFVTIVGKAPPIFSYETHRRAIAAAIRAAVEIDARELGVSLVEPTAGEPQRKKANYVGAPAIFALEQACAHINAAFDKYGCYLVGSALERPDFRDVDVRFIMDDADFDALFPGAGSRHWEHDPRWLLLTVSISAWMKSVTGLPIDFQIQPQTHANALHKKPRHAIGFQPHPRPTQGISP